MPAFAKHEGRPNRADSSAARATFAPVSGSWLQAKFRGSDTDAVVASRAGLTPDFSSVAVCASDSDQLSRNPGANAGRSGSHSLTDSVDAVLRGPGLRLDERSRHFFGARFGHDFSRVRIHTDSRAAASAEALNAKAYTVGRDLVFGRNEYSAASHAGRLLLAHELAHVVQQAGTSASLGTALEIGTRSDFAEREADAAARVALSPETERDRPNPAEAGHGCPALGSPTPSPDRRVLRRAPKDPTCDDEKNRSWAGCFETEWYAPTLQPDRKESRYGADIKIHFKPNALVDADKIAFSQTAQSSQAGSPVSIYFTDPKADEVSDPDIGPRIRGVGARNYGAKAKDVSLSRMIDPLESAAGTAIDALPANRSPLVGMSDPVKGSELSESVTTKNGTYGFRHGAKGSHEDATMRDYPGLILAKGVDAHQFFESTALAVAGPQKGVYYGSVQWGWKKGASDDKVSLLPFRLIRDATPSEDFGEARKLWNVSKNTRDEASIPLPTTSEMYINVKADLMDKPEKGKSLGKLDANTRVELTASGGGAKGWQSVVVVSGALVGKSGWLPEESLSDKPVAAKRGRASK